MALQSLLLLCTYFLQVFATTTSTCLHAHSRKSFASFFSLSLDFQSPILLPSLRVLINSGNNINWYLLSSRCEKSISAAASFFVMQDIINIKEKSSRYFNNYYFHSSETTTECLVLFGFIYNLRVVNTVHSRYTIFFYTKYLVKLRSPHHHYHQHHHRHQISWWWDPDILKKCQFQFFKYFYTDCTDALATTDGRIFFQPCYLFFFFKKSCCMHILCTTFYSSQKGNWGKETSKMDTF